MIAFNVNNVLIIHSEEPIKKGTVTVFSSKGWRVALYPLENTAFASIVLTLNTGYYTVIIWDGTVNKVIKIKINKSGISRNTQIKNKKKQNGEVVNESA